MTLKLIWRGILAGACGGLLAFGFARIFAEPLIQQAIDYETGRDKAQHALDQAAGVSAGHESAEIFSRTVQANLGAGIALVLFGAAMGALFAVAYALYLGRTGQVRPRVLALLVAGGGFLGCYFVPFLKYPANPPAIGQAATIGLRSSYFLVMVAASVLLLVLSGWLGQQLQARFGTWNATLIGAAAFLVAIAAVMLILPSVGDFAANRALHQATETPGPLTDAHGTIVFPGFPADVLYGFRVSSVGAQLVQWATTGLVFAALVQRVFAGRPTAAQPIPLT